MGETKTCTGCDRDLPVTSFTRWKNNPDGLATNCKQCGAEAKARRAEPRLQQQAAARRSAQERGLKHCYRCERALPAEAFSRNRKQPSGLSSECKACVKAYQEDYYSRPGASERRSATNRAYRESNPESIRRRELWTRYRTTPEWYDAKLQEQRGLCQICRRPAPSSTTLHIDHDHACCPGTRSCGACVRDLLCSRCNPALGAFDDSDVILQNAIDYVRRHRARSRQSG